MAAPIAVARTTDLRGVTSQASATREAPVRTEPHLTRSFAIQAFGKCPKGRGPKRQEVSARSSYLFRFSVLSQSFSSPSLSSFVFGLGAKLSREDEGRLSRGAGHGGDVGGAPSKPRASRSASPDNVTSNSRSDDLVISHRANKILNFRVEHFLPCANGRTYRGRSND
jgi:hypothetical protein